MKEKFVVTTFLAGHLADASISTIGIAANFSEHGFLANRLLETEGLPNALLAKMAVTAVVIGLYAFSKENNSRFFPPVYQAMRFTNLITWGLVALNSLKLVGYFR